MSRPTVRRLFSARERNFVQAQTVGKPTGVEVEISGFTFDLVPLTMSQGQMILDILDSVPEISKPGADGQVKVDGNRVLELISSEGTRVKELTRTLLLRSAKANGLIDADDDGEAVFDEWFNELELRPTITTLLPAIARANGLTSLLGNAPAPPAAADAATAQTALLT